MLSIIEIFSCAFAKGVVYELFTSDLDTVRGIGEPSPKFQSRVYQQRFMMMYNQTFKDNKSFEITYKVFVDKFPKLKEKFSLWGKRYSKSKKQFLESFNKEKWQKMDETKKLKHTLFECEECKKNLYLLEQGS